LLHSETVPLLQVHLQLQRELTPLLRVPLRRQWDTSPLLRPICQLRLETPPMLRATIRPSWGLIQKQNPPTLWLLDNSTTLLPPIVYLKSVMEPRIIYEAMQ